MDNLCHELGIGLPGPSVEWVGDGGVHIPGGKKDGAVNKHNVPMSSRSDVGTSTVML